MVKIIFSWLEYVIVFVFILFIWIFFEKYGLFILLVMWAFFPAYSYVVMDMTAKKCDFSIKMQSHIIGREEENNLIINVENKSFFMQGRAKLLIEIEDLFFGEKNEISMEVPLHSGSLEIKFPIRSLYCGLLQVKINRAEVSSMMNLFRKRKKVDIKAEYVVMPDKIEAVSMGRVVSGLGNDEIPDSDVRGNNSSQIREIEEYKPGDRLQKIHWKATAKKDELMVKEYEGTLSDQVTLIVELVKDKKVLEDILGLSFAIASVKIRDTEKITFQWWNNMAGEWKKLCLSSEEELEKAFEELFYNSPYEDDKLAYDQVMKEAELFGSVIYISGVYSEGVKNNEKLDIDISGERELLAGAVLLKPV